MEIVDFCLLINFVHFFVCCRLVATVEKTSKYAPFAGAQSKLELDSSSSALLYISKIFFSALMIWVMCLLSESWIEIFYYLVFVDVFPEGSELVEGLNWAFPI